MPADVDQGTQRAIPLADHGHGCVDDTVGEVVAGIGDLVQAANTDPVSEEQPAGLEGGEVRIDVGLAGQCHGILEGPCCGAGDRGQKIVDTGHEGRVSDGCHVSFTRTM